MISVGNGPSIATPQAMLGRWPYCYIAPLDVSIFQDARVADIGAGNGRFALTLLEAGAREVVAVEPSCSIEVIHEKAKQFPDGVLQPLHAAGDQLPPLGDFDVIISLGVVHHIEEPEPVVSAAYAALRPGGKFIV